MVKSFDMSKLNSFIQQASNTIMCNTECQKQKQAEKLKKAYLKSQETLASAPSQLHTTQRNYVVYTQGQTAYDELQDRELDEKATVIVDAFKENFDEEVTKIQSQISSYNGLLMNYKNVLELLMKYKKENGELFKDIKTETNDVLTNERKSYYEDQNIGSLKFYYFYFLLTIYVICVLCFAGFSLMYPSQSSWIVRFIIFILLLALPFFSTWILGMIIYLVYKGYNLLPKNVYI